MLKAILTICIFVFAWIPRTEQIACVDGDTVGQVPLTTRYPFFRDLTNNKGFLITDVIGEVQCYGVVKYWSIRCHQNGGVAFQIWRPTTGTDYALVGEYEYTFTDCETAEIRLQRNNNFNNGNRCRRSSIDLPTLPNNCANRVSAVRITGDHEWRVYYNSNYDDTAGSVLLGVGNWRSANGDFNDDDIESAHRDGVLRDTPEILPNWDKIPVRPGDVIGYVQKDTAGVIEYYPVASGSGACCEARSQSLFNPTVTNQYGWSPATTGGRMEIPLQVILTEGQTPQFLNLPQTIDLPENVAIGHTVYTVESQDWNEEYNIWGDTITYTMTHASFQIDPTTGIITTTGILDFETSPTYTLDVTVSDGELTSQETLTIQLTDVNEPHSATNLPAWLTVDAQTTNAGDLIGGPFTLQVVDEDAASTLQWILLTHTPADGTFALVDIGGNQAQIQCTQTLAMWDIDRYVLQVAVADTDGTFSSGPHNVTIEIININLVPYFVNLPGTITVPEDSTAAVVIFTLDARDPEGDVMTFTKIGTYPPDADPLFSFDPATGEVGITANPGFDFEGPWRQYSINFTVSDPDHTSIEATLNVDISDVNEPPTCVPANHSVTIVEKASVGYTIPYITLGAVDDDFSHGDYITYSVQTGYGDEYYTTSGDKLEILRVIDLGIDPDTEHEFDVHGVDSGGLTCSTTVNITVINVNDQHYITNLPDEIKVNAQTTAVGTIVYTIDVAPVEDFDIFTYRLDSYSPVDGLFTLNVTTGDIIMSYNSLPNWVKPQYEIYYSVLDQDGLIDGPKLLTINIVNRKDPPIIHVLPTTISLPETLSGVQVVFTVDAVDMDADPILGYTLVDYEPSDTMTKFTFNTANGELSIVALPNFDYESLTTYTMVFTARDYLYTSDNKTLTILITDVNEAPQFVVSAYTDRIPEELPIGTTLTLSPHALDVTDEDSNANLTYQIAGDPYSEYFSIDQDKLVVAKRMDMEAGFPSLVSLRVAVRDESGLEATATVDVTVYDINDNAPVFDSDSYYGKIQENTFGGTPILTVQASDKDSGSNGRFTYVIDDTGNDTSADIFFQIDSVSGLIRTKHQIDYDKYPIVVFDVFAVDEGSPSLTGTTTVTILVTDVNDIRPHFEEDFLNLAVPCDKKVGSHVATVSALDDDTVSNLTYYYLRYNARFAIGADSGEISVNRRLQCEKKYALYLLARDNGAPDRVSNVAIVRVDSFDPVKYLVDIELAVPLPEYEAIQDKFLKELHEVLNPWNVTIINVVGEYDLGRNRKRKLLQAVAGDDTQTVVTIYATETKMTDDVANLPLDKDFVRKKDLLEILQEDSDGTPTDVLKSTEFSEFYVTKVEPTYSEDEVWITDTAGGRATLAIVSLLALGLLVTLIGCLCYHGLWAACRRFYDDCRDRQNIRFINVTNPQPPPPESEDGFRLRYKNPEEYHHSKGAHARTSWLPGALASRFGRRVSTPHGETRDHGHALDSRGRPTTREYANGSPPSSAAYASWRDHKLPMQRSAPVTPRNVNLLG